MKRTYIKDLHNHSGEEITIKGWVDVARDQGKMAFFDFRDVTGKVQGVVFGKPEVLEVAKNLRPEWVVAVHGIVNDRNDKNAKEFKTIVEETGVRDFFIKDVEIEITGFEILNKAETPVFDITESTVETNEEVRLKNRYLDLRTARMQENMKMRHAVAKLCRDYLDENGFLELETPILTKSTPEGARDYVVPSRLSPQHFYALPQSPQQYKQLLMSSGMERYFQFARCMRDEDLRGDRQPEFTQLDLEMSFASEEDIMQMNEELLIKIVSELYPEKRIQQIPFPRIPYAEAMEKYGNDRPDIREDKDDPNLLAFCWIVDFPFFEKTADSDDPQATGEWTFTHNPFSLSKSEHVENLKNKENIGDIIAAQYDICLNGYEIGGGSVRAHDPEVLKSILSILGHSDEKIEENFGHMLKALGSGTPPHGGIAWGFDRLMMILQNEKTIREVIAFPKNGLGRDPMMEAPSTISEDQLNELSLELKEIKKPE
ncbi:MAG: OB-fold nucleic acid binding domain-containing protein [Candidatus Pacebacteria bacterium]|nr:OB-fold nucleic acid binding domain-containing protein [Candidatus Paceibacterota bacterium]